MDIKNQINTFLQKRMLGVISTIHDDTTPEAAYVAYRHSSQLELLIGTSRLSRKYKNILARPAVAFVVADFDGEIQYEGDAKEVTPADYDKLIANGVFQPLPGIEKYREDPDQSYIVVSPRWVRFILHGENDLIEELTEFV